MTIADNPTAKTPEPWIVNRPRPRTRGKKVMQIGSIRGHDRPPRRYSTRLFILDAIEFFAFSAIASAIGVRYLALRTNRRRSTSSGIRRNHHGGRYPGELGIAVPEVSLLFVNSTA